MGLVARGITIMSSPTGQALPIVFEPNPGYGISIPQESQTNSDYYALDHIHTSGTATDVYDYVLD